MTVSKNVELKEQDGSRRNGRRNVFQTARGNRTQSHGNSTTRSSWKEEKRMAVNGEDKSNLILNLFIKQPQDAFSFSCDISTLEKIFQEEFVEMICK